MKAALHWARSPVEREAIHELWYQIYVEEMRGLRGLDEAAKRRFLRRGEDVSRVLYAEIGGRIEGTVRMRAGFDGPLPEELVVTFGLEAVREQFADAEIVVFDRFMVRPEHRGSPLAFRMMRRITEFCTERGLQLALCECQPHLVELYERIGFRRYAGGHGRQSPSGILYPMALFCSDHANAWRTHPPPG